MKVGAGPVEDRTITFPLCVPAVLFGTTETLKNANNLGGSGGTGRTSSPREERLGEQWGTSRLRLRPAPAASSTKEMAARRCQVLIHICECETNKHSFAALGGVTLVFSAPGN